MLRPWFACVLALAMGACDADVASEAPPGGGGTAGPGGAGGSPVMCAPHELVVDGACFAAGVPAGACAEGFTSDGRGGCTPILPMEPCSAGTMALPGETTCRAVMECGDGTWGDIPREADTVYVDASAPGPGTGTAGDPFITVNAAISAVADGGQIAVAAGDYADIVVIDRPMRIWGRCPQMVTFNGDGFSTGIFVNADDVEVHGVSTSPNSFGVYVEGASFLLDRVWIHDTPDAGVAIVGGTDMVLVDSLIERVSGLGITTIGGSVTVERSVVRDMVAHDDAPGRALSIELDIPNGTPSSLTLRSSVIRTAREASIAIIGSTAEVAGSVLVDTAPQLDGRYGGGMVAQAHAQEPSRLDVSDTFLSGHHTYGVAALDAEVSLTRVTIEQVMPQASNGAFGDAVVVVATWFPALVHVRQSRVAGAARAGIANFDATVVLQDVALACNTIHLDGEVLNGAYTFDNLGGNACFCEDTSVVCKVATSSLEPPTL